MKKIVKSALLMTVMMLASKVLGLLREVFLAKQFGTSYIVDAYTVACTLPTVLFTLFASGFSNSYLPVYVRLNEEEKNRFFSNLTTILSLISLALMLVCMAFSRGIARLLAPGFEQETFELTAAFVRTIVLYLPLYTIFNLFAAHAGAKEDFVPVNFCDFIICNIIVIASILIATPEKPMVLIWGYILSVLVAAIVLGVHISRKKMVKYTFSCSFKDPAFLQICSLALPVGVAMLSNQINAVVDKMFSSSLGEGVTSALSYANKVQLIPYSLITSIFLTICLPRMNMCFAKNDNNGGLSYAKRALEIAWFIAIPVVFGILALSEPLIGFLFERGAFDDNATRITASCLVCYCVGMPFYAFREVCAKTLAAVLKQKLVLKNTVIAVATNILLNLIFSHFMGYKGLALATSVAGILAACMMNGELTKLDLHILDKRFFSMVAKVVVMSVISVFLGWGMYNFLINGMGLTAALLLSLALAAVCYIGLGIGFNVEIMIWLYSFLPEKMRIIKKWNR